MLKIIFFLTLTYYRRIIVLKIRILSLKEKSRRFTDVIDKTEAVDSVFKFISK